MSVWNPKANSLFSQAVEMSSPDQQATFLDEACAGDLSLRAEVEQLLKAHGDAGSFLERPLLDDQQTQDFAAATGRDDPLGANTSARDEVSLDFLESCDVPGRLGKIGPYEVLDVIGVGGMGMVLRAYDPKLNRIVAVKVMAPQFVVNPTARKRFLREAQAAAAVTHPNVVAIHAVDQTEKVSYLVMECINGLSLEQKIEHCGHLEPKEILRIGTQIAAGLTAAHAHGLVHRDIKPSNILLENGVERVRITDFGLARAVDDVSVTHTGEVAGTPQFMSPEQAQGMPVDHRSDLFSLGAVLYAMCTGRSPFRAETTVAVLRRVCDDVPRPMREVNPEIPEPLVTIVDGLLAKAPEDRFQTAQEVADLLLICLAHLQDSVSTSLPEALSSGRAGNRNTRPARVAPVGRWPRRSMVLAATVLLGLCVSVAVTEATGVTHLTAAILRIATGAGTLVVEVDDPQVSVTIDGEDLLITGTGPREVRLKPGRYRVQAAKGGQLLKQELVTIDSGGRRILRVELEPAAPPPAVAVLPAPTGPAPPPAIAPFDAATARKHQERWASHLGAPVEITNSIGMKMVLIPPGEFMMGSPDSDKSADDREKPQHLVRLTKPFYLGKYEVTQEQWEAVMGDNPSDFKGPKYPVEKVGWDDCQGFLKRLNEKAGGGKFQLPTEAQWEFACRAGSTTKWCCGDDESKLGEYAWYAANSGGKTHPVGEKKPNAWGLYDMHGNVREWCEDCAFRMYSQSPVEDPGGSASDSRVLRGEWFGVGPSGVRSAYRHWDRPGNRYGFGGFRVARTCDYQLLTTSPNAAPARETLPGDQFVDILARVDPARDRVVGSWTREGTSISNRSRIGSARTLVPITVDGEYDLRTEFIRQEGDSSVGIVAPVGDHYMILLLSSDNRNWWFNAGQSTNDHDRLLVNGKRHSLLLHVRFTAEKAHVDASLDNAALIHWEGSEKDLKADPYWQLSDSHAIGLTANYSIARFHSLQLKMISGKAWWNEPIVPVVSHGMRGAAVGTANSETVSQHDCEVAEWIGSIKAVVTIELASGRRMLVGDGPLPDVPFRIVGINLWYKDAVTDRDLTRLRGLDRLESIELVYTQASDETLKLLSELPNVSHIRTWWDRYTDEGVKSLGQMRKLRELCLEGANVTDVGLEGLRELNTIEVLNLSNAPINGPGLARLEKLASLRDLALDKTQIDDAGLASLPTLSALKVIGLARTRITDAGLEHLRKLPKLENLRVEGTRVTGNGLFRLHECLPACTFLADPPVMAEYCNLVLRKEPDNVVLYKQRAELRARYAQKWSEAAEDLAKVVELDPNDGELWHHRTMLLVKLQQKDLLSEHLGKMLARFQDDLDIGNRWRLIHGLAAFPLGKPEVIQAGEVLAEKLHSDLPANPYTKFFVAFARFRAGKYTEAESLLSQVTITDPGLWRYHPTIILAFHAMTKSKLNDREAANELLSKARETFKNASHDYQGADYGDNRWDRLSAEALLVEAESLITGAKR